MPFLLNQQPTTHPHTMFDFHWPLRCTLVNSALNGDFLFEIPGCLRSTVFAPAYQRVGRSGSKGFDSLRHCSGVVAVGWWTEASSDRGKRLNPCQWIRVVSPPGEISSSRNNHDGEHYKQIPHHTSASVWAKTANAMYGENKQWESFAI